MSMSSEPFHYIGNELELFSEAKNWKQYVAALITPWIKGDVLEVGAGIGTNTGLFYSSSVRSWLLLEPDQKFCKILESRLSEKLLPSICTVLNGYTSNIKKQEQFDTIIYIDVLEHIADDKAEMQTASRLLKKGGRLIILSPAHNFLMSPFDMAIGHYRRYSKKTLHALADEALIPDKLIYADTIGFFTVLANKYFLKQKSPTIKQINFWDKWIIPVSRVIDPILFYSAGKSVIGIWTKK